MDGKRTKILAAAAWLAACSLACAPALAGGGATRYANGRWFDGERFVLRDLFVEDGRVVGKPRRIARTVDLRGGFGAPALGEAHNHNLQNCFMAPDIGKSYVRLGILYSAQLFATDPRLDGCRALFDQPAMPSTAFARIGVTSSTGHPIGIALAGAKEAGEMVTREQVTDGMLIADSVADVERQWPAFRGRRTDFVKVILIDAAHGRENARRPELDGYNGVAPDVLDAVVRLARADGLRVVAHVDTAEDFRIAAQAGVGTIAHLPGYRIADGFRIGDYRLTEDAARAAADNGVAVIATISASGDYTDVHPDQAAAVAANYAANLRLLRAHGVRILAGSDRFDGNVIDELVRLRNTGAFTPAEVLAMAAIDTPRWMFPTRRVGCLQAGCEATFDVYPADPLRDLERLRRPRLVVKQGRQIGP